MFILLWSQNRLIEQWFNQTLYAWYYTMKHSGFLMPWLVTKSDTMLCILRFVNLGYTFSWFIVLSWQFVLGILLRYIHVFQCFDQSIKQTLFVSYSTVLTMIIFWAFKYYLRRLIEHFYNQTLCASYFTKVHSGFFFMI